MTRREAIRNIALASTATIFMTGCSDRIVMEMLSENKLFLDRRHMMYLAKISDTFLPVSNVSDKIGEPVTFILNILNDCLSDQEIKDFATGFEQYKTVMNESKLSIKKPDPEQIIKTVTTLLEAQDPQEELIHFINTVRGLSIDFLRTSEYYLTEYMEYEMIPKIYNPCLSV